MRAIDYVFRLIGLGLVWGGLSVLVIESGLFIPSDFLDLFLAVASLGTATVCTFIVWCGPDMFGRRSRRQAPDSDPE